MRTFGITTKTQSTQGVSLPAPKKLAAPNPAFATGYEFPVCKLVSVRFNAEKKVKRAGTESTTYVVEFLFKDAKDRQFTMIEWPVDPTSKNAANEPLWQDQRIKHIWDETIGADKLPEKGIGTSAKNEKEYFELIVKAFNDVKVLVPNPKYDPNATVIEGQPIVPQTVERVAYGQTPIYIKLTYNKTNLQVPLFPNFVQRAMVAGKQVPVEKLVIDIKHDQIEPSISASNAPSAAAGLATGLDATFGSANMDNELPEFLR